MYKESVQLISAWTVPLILVSIPLWAAVKKVPLYETFVDGAKEGFDVGIKIMPYLVAILFAIGMFRASGAIDLIANLFSSVLNFLKLPAEVLPLAIIKPLSGSGALGIMTEISSHNGGDSFTSRLAAVMVGSSETTFYVLTVYFGAIGIKKFRHAVIAGLFADIVGIILSIIICRIIF